LEGLKDKTRRTPCIQNRVVPGIEEAVMRMSCEKPAYRQLRASNELRKQGVLVSAGGIGTNHLYRKSETGIMDIAKEVMNYSIKHGGI